MENTILVVDARNRDLNCFVASATKLKTNNNAVVLRKAGGYVGSVNQLIGETIDFPILVVGSYQAKSSAGFTSQICRGVKFQKVIWVGGAGFGFSSYDEDTEKKVHKGYGLRPFCCPLSGTLIPKGAKICDVETHHNSNGSTANAARTSLGLMTKINPNLFILAEGQSDYVSATSFEVADTSTVSLNDFPDEHRADIFSGENMLDAGIRRMVGHNGNRIALWYALLNTVLSLGMRGYEANSFMATVPETVCEAVGHEQLRVSCRHDTLSC